MAHLRNISHVSCTSRTTLILILLLVSIFLLFDSYNWHFLPVPIWLTSASTSPAPSHAAAAQDTKPLNKGSSSQGNASDATRPSQSNVNLLPSQQNATAQMDMSLPFTNQSIPGTKNGSYEGSQPSASTGPSSSPPNLPLTSTTADHVQSLSLRRLEAGLRHSRSALRKVILETNITRALQAPESEDYQPLGAPYRDAAIFHQSYLEMEKKFRIFVYPEGEEPLVHNGPCKEIYAVEGRFIQELQGSNPFVTKDPKKAHVFFLPFSVTMMVTYLYAPHSMHRLLHFVGDYVDVVARKYPFWNRSEGADHFMLSCHDWGPRVSKARPNLEKNAVRVLCNANKSEGYVPIKDVSLPEINLIGGGISAELGGPSGNERPYLAFFAGRDHGPVRPILYKYWEGKDKDVRVYQTLPPKYSYQEFMKRSKFCICPGGYEVNSPRIVEAIYNDCVPVVIADNFVLPFSDVLDWEAFSMHVMEKDIPDLKRILEAVSMERYEEMQRRVRQVQRHFLLNQPPKRFDAFHMILHSVWLRRLNIRIG